MCTFDREPNRPNPLANHNITKITTTIFKMFLIFPSMGIYEFMSHKTTPIKLRVMRTDINDIFVLLSLITGGIKVFQMSPDKAGG
jgi:hypothetical protein